MRCGCPQCGAYMVQREQGLNSQCICPACLFTCSICMGGGRQSPLDPNELEALLDLREREMEEP